MKRARKFSKHVANDMMDELLENSMHYNTNFFKKLKDSPSLQKYFKKRILKYSHDEYRFGLNTWIGGLIGFQESLKYLPDDGYRYCDDIINTFKLSSGRSYELLDLFDVVVKLGNKFDTNRFCGVVMGDGVRQDIKILCVEILSNGPPHCYIPNLWEMAKKTGTSKSLLSSTFANKEKIPIGSCVDVLGPRPFFDFDLFWSIKSRLLPFLGIEPGVISIIIQKVLM